jgi:predicted MPP superfamily phosphohydrolase
MDYHDDFKILRLSDIHFGIEMNQTREFTRIKEMGESEEDVDLIVATGDSFLNATKQIVNDYCDLFDNFDIPWTYVHGNHDQQGDYEKLYVSKRVATSRNSLYVNIEDDDIDGYENFHIDLTKDGVISYGIYLLDSNSYYFNGLDYDYDIIHENQLDHIERTYKNSEVKPRSIAFFIYLCSNFRKLMMNTRQGNL